MKPLRITLQALVWVVAVAVAVWFVPQAWIEARGNLKLLALGGVVAGMVWHIATVMLVTIIGSLCRTKEERAESAKQRAQWDARFEAWDREAPPPIPFEPVPALRNTKKKTGRAPGGMAGV